MMKGTTVAIVGLSTLFREGLQLLLRRSRFTVVGHASTLAEVLEKYADSPPALALVALAPREDTGAVIRQIRGHASATQGMRIVMLTDPRSATQLREAAEAGVRAVLSKDITGGVLQRSLDLVQLGQQVFPGASHERPAPASAGALIPFAWPPAALPADVPARKADDLPVKRDSVQMGAATSKATVEPLRSTGLSDRERQILRRLIAGAANKTIARDLDITEATVKVHIKGLLRKIRVNNRTQAAVWGLNNPKLVEDEQKEACDARIAYIAARQAAL